MPRAAEESSKVTTHNGQGAAIFLLTRSDGDKLDLVDLTLHRSDGTQIEDLCCDGSSAAGRTVAVDPGIYFMRWEDTSGVEAEQTLVAVKDWQTQVFMLDEADSSPEHGRHHVSVLMSRESFDPASEMLRRSEEARAALADERKIATDVVSRSLFAKSENPMMGLYGTHLMLLARGVDENSARVNAPVYFDQDLYDTAVQNLGRLLGEDNPDVIALSTKTSAPPDPLPSVAAPPMLWRSWLLLLDASSKSPDVVPLHVSRQVSKRLPMRPFLVWSPVSEEAADKWQAELGSIVESSSQGTRELSKQLLVPQAALESAAESTES